MATGLELASDDANWGDSAPTWPRETGPTKEIRPGGEGAVAVSLLPSDAGEGAGRRKAEAAKAETSSPLEGSEQGGSRSQLSVGGAEDIVAMATGLTGPKDELGHSRGPEAERASGLVKITGTT